MSASAARIKIRRKTHYRGRVVLLNDPNSQPRHVFSEEKRRGGLHLKVGTTKDNATWELAALYKKCGNPTKDVQFRRRKQPTPRLEGWTGCGHINRLVAGMR